VGVGVYVNSIHIPFLWDDLPSIVNNVSIRHLWPLTGVLSPPLETPVSGRPVVNLSLALNFALGGLGVEGYHWWNIGVHVACALLLLAIVRRTLSGRELRSAFGQNAGAVAFVAAIVWLVHPLQTEAVDYVTQRTESMMGLFFLLTLYASIRAWEAPSGARWQVVAVAACVLGMCSKVSMAPAPLIVLLYDRAFESESCGEALRRHRWLYAGLASSWLVLALLVWMAPRSTVGASDAVGWPLYLANQAWVAGHYLRLVVWPLGLILDYGLPRALTVRDIWAPALVILGLAGLAVVGWRRWPAAGFAAVTFFLMLAPTSSVVPITSEVGAERRMYVPMMALVALATTAGWLYLDHLRRRAPGFARPVTWSTVTLTVGLVTALGAATIERNALFGDPVALWRDAVERWPHSRARLSLASALIGAGRGAEAIPELRLAARDYPDAKYALGAALHRTGQIDEAIVVLNEFVNARAPDASLVPARSELGKAYASQKKFDQAAAEYRAILEIAPRDADARERLGDVLLSAERYEDAAAEFTRVVQEVSRPELELKLAVALMRANQPDLAARHLERVLALDPRSADAHRNLAEIAWERGDVEPAVRHAEAALAIDSRNAGTHNFLGVVLASSGRVKEAIAHFQRALEIEPANTRARDNLARAEREVSRGRR